MRKVDLINEVSKTTGENPALIRKVIDSALDGMCQALIRGERIDLRRFGNFIPVTRKAKVGRNMNRREPGAKSEAIVIPSRIVPKFVPSKRHLVKKMNKI